MKRKRITIRCETAERGIFHSETLRSTSARGIAIKMRYWIAIEVAPYWPPNALRMHWVTSDEALDAAAFGVAHSFGYA